MVSYSQSCHNGSRCLCGGVLPTVDSLPNLFRRLEAGPVNAFGLTMREADSWESVRLMDVILDLASFRQTCVISARPGSAYAGRWAAISE